MASWFGLEWAAEMNPNLVWLSSFSFQISWRCGGKTVSESLYLNIPNRRSAFFQCSLSTACTAVEPRSTFCIFLPFFWDLQVQSIRVRFPWRSPVSATPKIYANLRFCACTDWWRALCCVETWGFPGMGISEISAKQICEFLHVPPNLDDWQAFVDAETSENFGYSVYSVDDVHRVGILDLRIDTWLNCPRLNQNERNEIGEEKGMQFEYDVNTSASCTFGSKLTQKPLPCIERWPKKWTVSDGWKGWKNERIKVNFDRNQGNLLLG